ncbi:MAG: hypothetical protein FJY81_06690, partial [Candidatus Aminicenantes bacterium]|nr:hypothetical protein [Candidatus Aminicenantes bacterium]
MDYFFVKDCRRKYRFISSDPATEIGEKVSRTKEIWRRARKKLLLLPPRILRQEQAFMDIPKDKRESIVVHH